jgi:hypothetical protein
MTTSSPSSTTNNMAAFHDCPTELVDAILERVSIRDLAALSLTSKKLYEFATPHLYSYIDLRIYRGNPRPIIHLTRSMFNPELAKHVKSVRLVDGDEKIQKLHKRYSYDEKVSQASPPRPRDEDGMPEFIEFIKKTGVSYADLWIDKLCIADLNAFVALLLSRLHNLKSFRIGYAAIVPYVERSGQRNPPNIAGENQFLGKLFQSAIFDTSNSNHGLSQFQQLEEISFPGPISVDPGRNPDFCNPNDMVALLSLPSIRSIRGWCWNPRSLPFTWPTEPPPNPIHLTSLTLSYLHVDFLAQILARTRALKTLSWTWKWIQGTHPLNTDTIDLNRFVEAVQPIRDTLEDLTIGFEFDEMSWGGIEPGMMKALGNLHGLEGFANIKRFRAPLGILLPAMPQIRTDD